MRLNKTLILWGIFSIIAFSSCSKEESFLPDSYSQSDFISNFKLVGNNNGTEPYVINAGNSVKLYIDGIQPNDKIVLEKDGVVMNMTWAYLRRPVSDTTDVNGIYVDSVMLKIERNSEWKEGEWEIKVRRDAVEDALGKIKFVVLNNVMSEYDADIDRLTLSAVGWNGTSADSLVFTSNDGLTKIRTGIVAETNKTTVEQSIISSLPISEMEDGIWKVGIERWEFGLNQNLAEVDFIKKGFVDDLPITKDPTDGKYKVEIKLNRVLSSDQLVMVSPTGSQSNIKLADQDFNEETHIVTVELPSNKLKDSGTYSFTLRRSGVYIMQAVKKEVKI